MSRRSKPNVLIVEDDSNMAQTLGSMVDLLGYAHSISHTSEEALQSVQKTLPDIVLLDVNLPDATGFDVCEKLREQKDLEKIPIIIVSVEGAEQAMRKAEDVGADRYLVKPVGIDDLEKAIEATLKM